MPKCGVAQRSEPFWPVVPPAVAAGARARAAARPGGCRHPARAASGPGGAPRHAQDEGVCALSAGARRHVHPGRQRRTAARGVVRAGAPHRAGGGAVFHAPVHANALGHPDTGAQHRLERPAAAARPWRTQSRCPAGRRGRAVVADLLPKHLQPSAFEAQDDAKGNAQALLEEPARGAVHQ